MNPHEKLRRFILENQKSSPGQGIHYAPGRLAIDFGVPQEYVWPILKDMQREGLVMLEENSGQAVVTVTARGAELFSKTSPNTIGFKAS